MEVWALVCGLGSGDVYGYFLSESDAVESLKLTYGDENVKKVADPIDRWVVRQPGPKFYPYSVVKIEINAGPLKLD